MEEQNKYAQAYEEIDNKKADKKILLAFIIPISLIVVFLVCFLIFTSKSGSDNKSIVNAGEKNLIVDKNAKTKEEVENEQPADPLTDKYVTFGGIPDSYIDNNSIVLLENLNEDFYLKYEIYNADTNELIYQTDLLEPELVVQWQPGNSLALGETTLTFREIPYYFSGEEYIPLTQVDNTAVFTKYE